LDKKIDNLENKLNTKIDNIEIRLNTKIDSTRLELIKLINDSREEVLKKVFENTQRIDELNKRIDNIYLSVGKAVNYNQIVDDLLLRMQKMESKLDQNYINELVNLIKLYTQNKKE
jgi:predicted DsbA family dithiol-disulfide isomerase